MNIKKIIFNILTFIFIINAQVVYTKEQQDDNKNSQSTINSDHNNNPDNTIQYQEEMWQFIEETFQTTIDQTQRIEFCLQTIEQIINAGKLKFDNKKISKTDLLQEIKSIKHNIQGICEYFSKKFSKHESMVVIICYNTAFIQYLLPIFQNDITTLNVKNFDAYLEQNIEQISNKLQDPAQLATIIEINEANLQLLMKASDLAGLSTFNKLYHYLDTKPLPWYGKSSIATAKDIALWGSAVLLIYSLGVYGLSKDCPIYGTWKEIDAKKEAKTVSDASDLATNKEKSWLWRWATNNDPMPGSTARKAQQANLADHAPANLSKAALQQPKKSSSQEEDEIKTWTHNDTTYTNWTVADLPFKRLLGDYHEVIESRQPGLSSKEKKTIRTDFGVISYMHDTTLTYADPFMIGSIGALTWLIKKPALELFENAKKSLNHAFNYHIKGDITPPKSAADMTKVYFDEMIGGEHLEKLARELTDYLKNPTRYERAGISPSTGFLLVGPSQTGKSFFAKALKTMIDEEFDNTNEKVKFATITNDDLKYFTGFTEIFYWARKNAPIILFIDEIDMFGTRRDRNEKNTQELLTAMNGMETDPSKKVIVIGATNKPEELDFALKQKGRLGTVITFDVPSYECRKAYLEKQLTKRNIILPFEIIDTIAQETDGQTYNMIEDIIRQALQLSTFQTRPVEEADFEITLDREIRKIKPNTTMAASEKELVAIYQAGQAAARHVLATDQHIVKITVDTVDKPMKSKEGFGVIHEQKGEQHENYELLPQNRIKPTRLGFVFTMSKTNNHELISDLDQKKELIALLSGQAALELIKGKTFNGFGKEDRAKVIEILEKQISQGTPITDAIRQQALAAKDVLYQQAKVALQNHTQFVQIIADELIKNNTINTKQWQQLSANYTV